MCSTNTWHFVFYLKYACNGNASQNMKHGRKLNFGKKVEHPKCRLVWLPHVPGQENVCVLPHSPSQSLLPFQFQIRLAVRQKPRRSRNGLFYEDMNAHNGKKEVLKNEIVMRNLFQDINVVVHKHRTLPIVQLPESQG